MEQKTDEVLLRISAEAELNKDAGYVTDSYGNPVYGARTLRFGYMSLRYMNNAGIDAISFSNKTPRSSCACRTSSPTTWRKPSSRRAAT